MEQKGLDFGIQAQPGPPRRRALSVSELTDRIQGVLEVDFADVWVEGEVSNLKTPPSGHFYFSLKDENAQIRAVVWKSDARLVQVLEPLGKGSLQQAFEDLKERLGKEGLFNPGRKRPLPMLPRRVGLVTSP